MRSADSFFQHYFTQAEENFNQINKDAVKVQQLLKCLGSVHEKACKGAGLC